MTPAFVLTILAAALATYGTRVAGYILISNMSRIPPRLEAALNSVPTAVLSALVAPSFVYYGVDVTITMVLAVLVGLRAPSLLMLAVAWFFIVTLRMVLG